MPQRLGRGGSMGKIKFQLFAITAEEIKKMETHYPGEFLGKGEFFKEVEIEEDRVSFLGPLPREVLCQALAQEVPDSGKFFYVVDSQDGKVLYDSKVHKCFCRTALLLNAAGIYDGGVRDFFELRNINGGKGALTNFWRVNTIGYKHGSYQ
jgi:hypothetical protein